MNPVRVGVIGIGNMGWHHARVLSLLRDAELVGVADPDAARGSLAVEQFNCRWFEDHRELLQEVLDNTQDPALRTKAQGMLDTLG